MTAGFAFETSWSTRLLPDGRALFRLWAPALERGGLVSEASGAPWTIPPGMRAHPRDTLFAWPDGAAMELAGGVLSGWSVIFELKNARMAEETRDGD